MRRNYARERSELHRKVRPLGQFIADAARAKVSGVPPIPRVLPAATSNGAQPSVQQNTAGQSLRAKVCRSTREAPVLHACLRWLHQQGIFAWRQNTGTAWLGDQPVSFGYPGAGDITGILPDGRRLEVECKSTTGKQSEKQAKFQAKIEQNRGVYLLVRSEEELCQMLEPILNYAA